MPIQQTSIKAYIDLCGSKLVGQQRLVLDCMKRDTNYTDQEMTRITGLPINMLTARRNELVKARLILFDTGRKCKVTGRNVMSWIKR